MVAVSAARGGSTRLIKRGSILYRPVPRRLRPDRDQGRSRYLLRNTLNKIERRWEQFDLFRVHRQYVANLARAVELRPLLGGTAELALATAR